MKFKFEGNLENRAKKNEPIIYHLESGLDAEVSYKVFESKEANSDEVIVFLPGLTMNPDDEIIKNLGQSYAESSKRNTYVIKSELKTKSQNQEQINEVKETLFFEEALALKQFIQDKNFKNIIIAGYSVGGTKGIDLAYLLQNNVGVSVQGLILLSAPGLYKQEEGSLKKNLIEDSLATPKIVVSESDKYPDAFKRGIQGAKSFAKIMLQDSSLSSTEVRQKVKRNFTEMEEYNPRVEELEIPVVIIQGSEDKVVEADKIVPQEIDLAQREEYLKEHIFKKSPYVKMVTADKLGKHGLPIFRAESVAKVSIGLLERFNQK
jgi:esterase/lipase